VSYFTLRTIIVLMETMKDFYSSTTIPAIYWLDVGHDTTTAMKTHYQRCRQTQKYRCDKYHRVGRHLCEKLGHLQAPGRTWRGASALIVAPTPDNAKVRPCKAPPGLDRGGAPVGDFCCSDAEVTLLTLFPERTMLRLLPPLVIRADERRRVKAVRQS
jgi:hypothetical protein